MATTVDKDGKLQEDDEPVRITSVPRDHPSLQPRTGAHDAIPERMKADVIAPPENPWKLTFWDLLVIKTDEYRQAAALVWKWLPQLINLVYYWKTMNYRTIVTCLVMLIMAGLTQWLGIGADYTVLNFIRLDDLLSIAIIFGGGFLLPDLRQFLPEAIAKAFGKRYPLPERPGEEKK